MDCCAHCAAIDDTFDRKLAAREIAKYRKRGPTVSTRRLLAALGAEVSNASVLDVGGGVGTIAHEVLARGAARATIVDASTGSLAEARQESERRGTGGRLDVVHGDFTALAARVPTADVVTLDKVVCCYPDMERLLAATTGHAGRLFGIVFPRDLSLVRAVTSVHNAIRRLQKSAFRVYVWPHPAIDGAIRRAGFTLRSEDRGLVWIVRVYVRSPER
jgi:magnesium-protoporphyrin O-methyltransferase